MSQKHQVIIKKNNNKKNIPQVNVKYFSISEPSELADTMITAC